jgi:anthranilate synthase/aminodeoxychorismate synthase-like glutamine amidotransferase
MILVIDNYDSFTYNLVQIIQGLGCRVSVRRNDEIRIRDIEDARPDAVVISPGPGDPRGAGISVEVIRSLGEGLPILGVCLGHQCIAEAFGGKIVRAGRIMHGKTSPILHDGRTIYRDMPSPFDATRYHSLSADPASLPDCLEVSSWTEEGEVMGVRHRTYAVEGVQFHPESILTRFGRRILENFVNIYGKEESHGHD